MDAGQPRGCHLMINGRNTEQQGQQDKDLGKET